MMGERWRRKKNAWGLSISRTHLYLSEIDSKGNMQQRRYLKGGGVHTESSVKFTEDSAVSDILSKRNL